MATLLAAPTPGSSRAEEEESPGLVGHLMSNSSLAQEALRVRSVTGHLTSGYLPAYPPGTHLQIGPWQSQPRAGAEPGSSELRGWAAIWPEGRME